MDNNGNGNNDDNRDKDIDDIEGDKDDNDVNNVAENFNYILSPSNGICSRRPCCCC
jgi:hypothetical protein